MPLLLIAPFTADSTACRSLSEMCDASARKDRTVLLITLFVEDLVRVPYFACHAHIYKLAYTVI